MKLKVNGEDKELSPTPKSPSLELVVKELGFHPKLVVVEFNGTIISPSHWQEQTVKDGDTLEIVTIVGGGS